MDERQQSLSVSIKFDRLLKEKISVILLCACLSCNQDINRDIVEFTCDLMHNTAA